LGDSFRYIIQLALDGCRLVECNTATSRGSRRLFRFSGHEALLYVPEPADAERTHVLRAAAACPVGAILVDVDDLDDPR